MDIVVFKTKHGDVFVNPEKVTYFREPLSGSKGTAIYFGKDDYVLVDDDPDMVSVALTME